MAAVESAGNPLLGQDAGTLAGIAPLGVALAAELTAAADVMVDFSVPAAAAALIETCRRLRLPLVVATTGLGGPQLDALRAAAKEIPLVWSPNMSLAVNLTMKLCETAAKALADKDVDVEVLERHHRFKEDCAQRDGAALRRDHCRRDGADRASSRPPRAARKAAPRGDRLSCRPRWRRSRPAHHHLRHVGRDDRADRSRDQPRLLRLGALAAAKFLAGKAPGLYGMNDVLGL